MYPAGVALVRWPGGAVGVPSPGIHVLAPNLE
jgi:hypothetical protein